MEMNEIRQKNAETIANMLDVGELLLSNGAGVSRVEDTLERLAAAYDYARCDVHAINSSIIVTLTTRDGLIETQARRIRQINTNLRIVEEANALSRRICAGEVDPERIHQDVEAIRAIKAYPPLLGYLGYVLGGSFFTLFFGGGLPEMVCEALIALLLRKVQARLRSWKTNSMVENILLSAICALMAFLFRGLLPLVNPNWVVNPDLIIIGNTMLLIPGLAFCNAIRDMISGDTISGLLTLSDALLRAFSIAVGYTIAWFTIGRLL